MSIQLADRLTTILETTLNPGTGRRWTAKELVDTINARGEVLSYSYFSSLRTGARTNPDPAIIRAIANALGVSAASLLVDESELPELPPAVLQFARTPADAALLGEAVKTLIAARDQGANSARIAALPEFLSLDVVTEVEAYAASGVTRRLSEAAEVLRTDLHQPAMATVIDELVRRIRAHFAGLGPASTDAKATAAGKPGE